MKVTEDMSFAAAWQARSDTPFRVEHYLQRLDGISGYYLPLDGGCVESRVATTGADITLSDYQLSDAGLSYHHAAVNGTEITAAKVAADGSLVVKLYYDRKSFDLVLNAENGSSPNPVPTLYGAKLTLPTPAKAGYEFAGWYEGAERFEGTTMPARNLTLTAHWTESTNTAYTVEHYDQNADGSYPNNASHTETLYGTTGAEVTAIGKPSSSHYSEDTGNNNTVKTGTIAANGSLVLKVYYARSKYTVRFVDGETELLAVTDRWGTSFTPPAPTKDGYTLSWNPALPADNTIPQADTTYTAVWTAMGDIAYKVEHYQQNADDNDYTLADTVDLTGATDADVTAAAKRYDHFTENTTHSGRVPTGTIAADGSLVLKLYYDRETVTVTFDANDGVLNDAPTAAYRYEQTFTAPTAPTRTDYGFAGWYDGDAPYTGGSTKVTKNVTLTAKWSAGDVSYTVAHYLMGTDGSYENVKPITENGTAKIGSSLVLNDLVKTNLGGGFAYDGTTTEANNAITDGSVTVSADMTVKLYYTRSQFELAWNLGEGCTVTNESSYTRAGRVYYDAAIVRPELTKAGHSYRWNGEPAATMPANDVTYTAEWTINQYTITFNTDGGSTVDAITQDYGTAIAAPADPTREGYTFAGWSEAIPTAMPAENMTITAEWTINQYTITFNTDGGSAVDAITQDYGTTVQAPVNPTKEGYRFAGWLLNGAAYTFGTMPAENINLTAEWEEDRYTLTLDYGDDALNTTYASKRVSQQVSGAYLYLNTSASRLGYTFAGWFDASGKEYTSGSSRMPAQNLTLRARWTLIEYTLTLWTEPTWDSLKKTYRARVASDQEDYTSVSNSYRKKFTIETPDWPLPKMEVYKSNGQTGIYKEFNILTKSYRVVNWQDQNSTTGAWEVVAKDKFIAKDLIERMGSTTALGLNPYLEQVEVKIDTAEEFLQFRKDFETEYDPDVPVTIKDGLNITLPEDWKPFDRYTGKIKLSDGFVSVTFLMDGSEPLFNDFGGTLNHFNIALQKPVMLSGVDADWGALARRNTGSISYCRVYPASAASVIQVDENSGLKNVGGLVGSNSGTLTECRAGLKDTILSIQNPIADTCTGGLIGRNTGKVSNQNSNYATSNISLSIVDTAGAGGLAGYNGNTAGIESIASAVTIKTGDSDGSSRNIGGAVGHNEGGTIKVSNISADIQITAGGTNVGGAVGWMQGGTLQSCTVVGSISAPDGTNVGGVIGNLTGSATVGSSYDKVSLGAGGALALDGKYNLLKVVVQGKENVGGIVGSVDDANTTFGQLRLYSYSSITIGGTTNVGGFFGRYAGAQSPETLKLKMIGASNSTIGITGSDESETTGLICGSNSSGTTLALTARDSSEKAPTVTVNGVTHPTE